MAAPPWGTTAAPKFYWIDSETKPAPRRNREASGCPNRVRIVRTDACRQGCGLYRALHLSQVCWQESPPAMWHCIHSLPALGRFSSLKQEERYHSLLVPLSGRGKVHSRPFSTRSIGGNANGFHGRRASHPSDAALYPQSISLWNLPNIFLL